MRKIFSPVQFDFRARNVGPPERKTLFPAKTARLKIRNRLAVLAVLLSASWATPALPQAEKKSPPPGAPTADRPTLAKGDCWRYRNLNVRKGPSESVRCVVKVLNDGYVMRTKGRVEGLARYDRNLVWLGSIGQNRVIRQPGRSRPPLRLNFPLWVGKSWSDSYRVLDETLTGFHHFANLYVVEAVETIRISSQDILTFRIRWIRKSVASGESAEGHTWYAPAVRNVVRIQNNWPGGTNLILTGFKPSSNPPQTTGRRKSK